MSVKELSNNRTAVTLLLAAFVAVESYFLSLMLGSIIGRFWLSGVVLNILAVFAAYLITDAITKRTNQSRRKKAIVAVAVLIITVIVAITFSVVTLYFDKLRLQSIYN